MTGSQELSEAAAGRPGRRCRRSRPVQRRQVVELERGLDDALQVLGPQVQPFAAVGEVSARAGQLGVEHVLATHHPGDRVLLGLARGGS